ncbi:hypothetical protein GCM10017778_08920 [Streptomyces vinaceus]|nr:hypothetical protein GCM10017778_08920 [Streptomyces vinaceus]
MPVGQYASHGDGGEEAEGPGGEDQAEAGLARVSSLDFLVSYGLAPVGLALIAPAIEAFGVTAVLGACAGACFLVPAAAALVPTGRHFGRTPTPATH